MNKNEFKKEYLEYKEGLYEIDKALEENVNDFLKVEKNSNFMFIEYEDDEITRYIMDNMEPEELPDLEELHEEYHGYIKHLSSKVYERLELFDRRMEIINRFEKYMEKNNLIYWDIDEEWRKEAKKYDMKWYGWSSNDLMCRTLYQSIWETDEEEINKVIENARKVMELIDNQSYDIGFIDDLEFINKYIRHGEGCDGCEHVFILDCLENDCMLNICKEPFISFVQKLCYSIDRDYLAYLKDKEMEEAYNDSEE
jgi:hypothetical protein